MNVEPEKMMEKMGAMNTYEDLRKEMRRKIKPGLYLKNFFDKIGTKNEHNVGPRVSFNISNK